VGGGVLGVLGVYSGGLDGVIGVGGGGLCVLGVYGADIIIWTEGPVNRTSHPFISHWRSVL
jgi:hypothetical protein